MGEFEFMDMMYSRYTCPIEFMNIYIENGQFGQLVKDIIESNNKRKQEESEKENDHKMWELYLHSMSDKSFNDWKKEIQTQSQPVTHAMSNAQVDATINNSREILKSFKF